MFKKIMLKFGFISIETVEAEIEKVSKEFDNRVPSVKFKDGTKNTVFFKERLLTSEFIHRLDGLKIDLRYYY
jgi:hypothetical protein